MGPKTKEGGFKGPEYGPCVIDDKKKFCAYGQEENRRAQRGGGMEKEDGKGDLLNTC